MGRLGSASRLLTICALLAGCAAGGQTITKEREASAHYKLGVSYLNDNAIQPAFLEFQKAVELNPNDKVSHYYLGFIYYHQQKSPLALKELEKAVKIDPDYSDAYNLMGTVYGTMKDYDSAIKYFKKALQNKLYETPQKGHYNIGLIYFEQARYSAAIGEFQEAINIDPGYVDAYWLRGESYLKAGNGKDAFSSFEEAGRLAPGDALLHFKLGEKYWEKGSRQMADEEFKKVVSLAPDSEMAKEARRYLERRR